MINGYKKQSKDTIIDFIKCRDITGFQPSRWVANTKLDLYLVKMCRMTSILLREKFSNRFFIHQKSHLVIGFQKEWVKMERWSHAVPWPGQLKKHRTSKNRGSRGLHYQVHRWISMSSFRYLINMLLRDNMKASQQEAALRLGIKSIDCSTIHQCVQLQSSLQNHTFHLPYKRMKLELALLLQNLLMLPYIGGNQLVVLGCLVEF